ncbi:MAG TPA: hypothetical protein VD978_00820 [Azospirillum sp.]|nr:hypothetical protein [Azospirillum sp.]
MSLHTDPDERVRPLADAIADYVAREHWRPILIQALVHGTILASFGHILHLPVSQTLALMHVVASVSGLFGGLLAVRLDEMGQSAAAVSIARRALAALLVSGTALLLVPFAP